MAPKNAASSGKGAVKTGNLTDADMGDIAMQEDVPPLNFETEEELISVIDKLREELESRVTSQCEKEGPGVTKDTVDRIVLKQFLGKMAPMITSNCSIGGVPYLKYKKIKDQGKSVPTQPFQEDLHEKVIRYQDQLFEARAENAMKRKTLPQQTANALREKLSKDMERIAQLEKIASLPIEIVPAISPSVSSTRSRKSVAAAAASSNAAEEAEENFMIGKQDLDKLLSDIPALVTKVENAAQISADVAALR